MMTDLNSSQEKAILELMTRITSIVDLSTLLGVVVQELPSVVGARGCWIYLQSDYVPKYSGVLRRGDNEIAEEDLPQMYDDFIVLAATNLDSKKALIGNAYFGSGEGITGWVYANGKPLRITNVADDNELKELSPDLAWANEYHDGDELYGPEDKRPLLAVPLILDDITIGTLKFHATIDKKPFSETSQEVAIIVSQIISGVLRQSWVVAEQNQIISRLIETSHKQAHLEVIADITGSMKELLNCSVVAFFIRSADGAKLWLQAKNGAELELPNAFQLERGKGLIGWVFKTGLPLIVPDIKMVMNGVYLNDELLEKFSISNEINDEDRFLKYDQDPSYPVTSKFQSISFVAVPVLSKDQEVEGVLCGYHSALAKTPSLSERTQLTLATSFANSIALVLENRRQKILGELLIELGNLSQTAELFSAVTERIPKLVASSGCSIFTSVIRSGVMRLRLTHTSRQGLMMEGNKPPKIEYDLGEAKTGLCGHYQSILVVNHYGNGKISCKRIDSEIQRINLEHPNDITSVLIDVSGNKVGLFHLQAEERFPLLRRHAIREFANRVVVQSDGIPSEKLDSLHEDESGNTWSYVAVPIKSEKKLLGVITLARPIPESPFLGGDISLLRSLAGRLASVMDNLRIIEQREKLVMSLAHEINTPLTGILADSQNLYSEAPENTDLREIAGHNLQQVQRLQMQAWAIMSVLAEKRTSKQFAKHSIFRPLKEACELFRAEALHNGCEILGPRGRDGDFPVIEMSLFDLTIAFKNIVHNAVKYSFRPPASSESQKTIKVWGQWNEKNSNYYDVYVQNYGVGIDLFEIEKRLIFEPYYRGEKASRRRRTGSGFGLAQARLVIEEIHSGFINAASIHQSGDGYITTVIVTLPIKQPK